jgi:hypothetical protein
MSETAPVETLLKEFRDFANEFTDKFNQAQRERPEGGREGEVTPNEGADTSNPHK